MTPTKRLLGITSLALAATLACDGVEAETPAAPEAPAPAAQAEGPAKPAVPAEPAVQAPAAAPAEAPKARAPEPKPTPTGHAAAPSSNGLKSGPANPAVVERARAIQKDLECMRGRSFKKDPEIAFQSLDDFRAYVTRQLEKELAGEKGARQVRALHALDIVDPSIDVIKQLADAAVGQAAAYYDPDTNAFYVVQEMEDLMLNMVMAHELQHALQDQHTSMLDQYLGDGFGSTDTDLATRFVVEGEAQLVGSAWMAYDLQRKIGVDNTICYLPGKKTGTPQAFWAPMGAAMSDAASKTRDDIVNPGVLDRLAMKGMSEGMANSMKQLRELPVYFFYTLLLPYNQGGQTVFTHFEANRYDWQPIDGLFEKPPETTEQVLHPGKLEGEREAFRKHTLSEQAPLSEADAAGWQSDPVDRLGELSLRILLIEEGIDEGTATQAAAGWDGDAIRVWHKGEDRLAFDWTIGWDRPQDRAEFLKVLPAAIAKQREITDTTFIDNLANGNDEGEVGFQWTDKQGRTRYGRIQWTKSLVHWTDGWENPPV